MKKTKTVKKTSQDVNEALTQLVRSLDFTVETIDSYIKSNHKDNCGIPDFVYGLNLCNNYLSYASLIARGSIKEIEGAINNEQR